LDAERRILNSFSNSGFPVKTRITKSRWPVRDRACVDPRMLRPTIKQQMMSTLTKDR